MYYYAEMVVGDRIVHRQWANTQATADKIAREMIVKLFPEDRTMAECYDFNYAAYWNENDLGESVMINPVVSRSAKAVGMHTR